MKIQKYNINYYKLQGKKLKRELGIPHIEALNEVAKKHGFANWTDCQRQVLVGSETAKTEFPKLSFTIWLKKQKNRDSPLGDLSREMNNDKNWPSHNDHQSYEDYLYSHGAGWQAIDTLKKAWKSYQNNLKRQFLPKKAKPAVKKQSVQGDSRRVVIVKNIIPIHFNKRTVEKFQVGDKAWISWDARKAIPVTITEIGEQNYSFVIERPLKKAGNKHHLFLDEVRSTPELACINCVTS
ncbi:hypothetical protein ASE74_16420 [Pedobacter sp. Leaf216]|uniref:YozE family protein n=1 Tax=Pedobacter sp. Leaf216 TaxID=1735684 RepID=UPI0006F98353|nr:YozE family protein [Pedobacter sp. Leaf216]KQM77974.1 hypothetical protein ASE74_16420 [Pedobacter sp. Leaf216]